MERFLSMAYSVSRSAAPRGGGDFRGPSALTAAQRPLLTAKSTASRMVLTTASSTSTAARALCDAASAAAPPLPRGLFFSIPRHPENRCTSFLNPLPFSKVQAAPLWDLSWRGESSW